MNGKINFEELHKQAQPSMTMEKFELIVQSSESIRS